MFQEIITLDGNQYKLDSDIPLTSEQRVQTIEEIKRQVILGNGLNRIQSLAPTCPNSAPYYNKKYYGIQYTASGTPGPGVILLRSQPSGGTSPYTVKFYKDASATELAGTTQPVTGTFENWYVPLSTDVTTGSPAGSHAFNSTVLDSCTGSTLVTETPCTMVIVDLGSMTANPLNIVMGAGQYQDVSFTYLDTVGAAYPTTFTGSTTQLIARQPIITGPIGMVSITGWTVDSVAPTSARINMSASAQAGTTYTVNFPVRVGTSGTNANKTVNIQVCTAPVCNFSVT